MAPFIALGSLRPGKAQAGFGYLMVLLIALVLGVASTITYEQQETLARREREQEWLFVGLQYKQAIKRYYQQSPQGIKELPEAIKDLLQDPRYVSAHHYLRQAYPDPMTQQEWQLVLDDNGRIIGVVSTSIAPILQLSYVLERLNIAQAESTPTTYAEVRFVLEKTDLAQESKDENDGGEGNETNGGNEANPSDSLQSNNGGDLPMLPMQN